MDLAEMKMMLRGRELDFITFAGIPFDVANNRKHQPCNCGESKDRLRITKTGQYYCNQGTNGDYIDLLDHYSSISFKETMNLAKEFLGVSVLSDKEMQEIKKKAKQQQRASKIKAAVKDDNARLDFNVLSALEDYEILVRERKESIFPTDEEIKASNNLILELLARYNKIHDKIKWLEEH